jgi:hypothetical protein
MTNQMTLSSINTTLSILYWKNQAVITFAMIDEIHQRPEGTASRNFRKNRKHLIEGDDYFELNYSQIIEVDEFRRLPHKPRELILFTLFGYTMLVKSFKDDLAWKVQRELVGGYFNPHEENTQALNINDLFKINKKTPLLKIATEITCTLEGEILNTNELSRESYFMDEPQHSMKAPQSGINPTQPSIISDQDQPPKHKEKISDLWMIETLFEAIENNNLPEKTRQNMLITKEIIQLSNGESTVHQCLFFRLSNIISFLRQQAHDALHQSPIRKTQDLLAQLEQAGILAFAGKTKEKSIPIEPTKLGNQRRVSNLIAIDLVILEQEYGIVIINSKAIAKNFS